MKALVRRLESLLISWKESIFETYQEVQERLRAVQNLYSNLFCSKNAPDTNGIEVVVHKCVSFVLSGNAPNQSKGPNFPVKDMASLVEMCQCVLILLVLSIISFVAVCLGITFGRPYFCSKRSNAVS